MSRHSFSRPRIPPDHSQARHSNLDSFTISSQGPSHPKSQLPDHSRLHIVPDHSPLPHFPDFDDNETVASPDSPTIDDQNTRFLQRASQTMDPSESDTDDSVFDDPTTNGNPYALTDPTQPDSRNPSGQDRPGSYDLKPPPPASALSNLELLSDRLFSVDHLKLILRDPLLFSRFSFFLNKYRPQSATLLQRFVDTQKAVAAVEYANALAGNMTRGAPAAELDPNFESIAGAAVDDLVNDTLPGYVTHRFVQIVTETLVKEITGQNTPIMRELVHGLAEVYCLTDPSIPDNPIVYASEEFFRTTQYGRDYVIGRNCRFLQGPRSSGACVQRLVDALAEGQEICETILNYRRDGSPFMNLLMIAPLYDNRGAVRYFIGAQIDINGLIENGRGLESFEKLLGQDRSAQRYGGSPVKQPQAVLAELSAMWSNEEIDITKRYGRERSASETSQPMKKSNTGRRYLGMEDPADRDLWPAPQLGGSGRLPGVFQNYLLVRPFPSLRITFTSPALRIPGLLQSKFLDRIGGPTHIRDGIMSALSSGIGVTAKVTWYPGANHMDQQAPQLHDGIGHQSPAGSRPSSKAGRNGRGHGLGSIRESENDGQTRWIHCTPLLGSDEKVGVWMIVMVDAGSVTGAINAHERAAEANASASRSINSSVRSPRRQQTAGQATAGANPPKYSNSNKLYRDQVRREPKDDTLIENAHNSGIVVGNGYPGAARTSTAPSRTGTSGSKGQEDKKAKAQKLAERARIGEETFKDF